MNASLAIEAPVLPPQRAGLRRSARGNAALTLFVTLALLVSMSVTQEEAPEPGSFRYWLLVLSASLLPLTGLRQITRTLLGGGWWLLLFLITGGVWHLLKGDMRAVLQLGLLVWVTAWISSDAARLKSEYIVGLYMVLVVIGCLVYLATDLNGWGPLPGLTVAEYGVWRVSFFPNIAYTAFLSLVVIMILTRQRVRETWHAVVLGVAAYFLVTSFVRTALIALAMYAGLRWWFARRATPSHLFWGAMVVGFGINLAIAGSVFVLDYLQQFPLVSRLFLRGETQLSTEEIFQQLFRPWLWWEHVQQFVASPSLMGWGAFDFEDLKITALIEGQEQGDTVSLLTRLLAAYGLPGALFTAYLVARLRAAARARDAWSCACFAPVLLLVLQWGSVFHPSDALFALFLMTVVRGSVAFPEAIRTPRPRTASQLQAPA
jgi:hypothetical protein